MEGALLAEVNVPTFQDRIDNMQTCRWRCLLPYLDVAIYSLALASLVHVVFHVNKFPPDGRQMILRLERPCIEIITFSFDPAWVAVAHWSEDTLDLQPGDLNLNEGSED